MPVERKANYHRAREGPQAQVDPLMSGLLLVSSKGLTTASIGTGHPLTIACSLALGLRELMLVSRNRLQVAHIFCKRPES